MQIRVCPKCGRHNSATAWSCIICGETLSTNTITENALGPDTSDMEDLTRDQSESENDDAQTSIALLNQLNESLLEVQRYQYKMLNAISELSRRITEAQEPHSSTVLDSGENE